MTFVTSRAIAIAAAAAASFGLVHNASAQTPPAISHFYADLTNNSANDSYLATGQFYLLQAELAVAPVISTTPTFSSTVYGYVSQGGTTEALFTKPYAVAPSLVAASVPVSTGLSGSWTMTVSSTPGFDSGTTTTVTTPSLSGVPLMPFVQSMAINPGTNPLNPTISWTDPASSPTISKVRISVTDNSAPVQRFNIDPQNPPALVPYGQSFTQGDRVYNSPVLSGGATSFAIPTLNDNSGNADYNTPVLQYGHHYTIGIELQHAASPPTSGCELCNVVTRSQSFFDYTPINPVSLGLPADAVINMPTTKPVPTTTGLYAGPVYQFNAPIVQGGVTYIDPVVATGFLYDAAGGPNFASVNAVTHVGSGIYQLWAWNGSIFEEVDNSFAAGSTFDFLANGFSTGVSKFEILGIDPSAGLSPTDLTAFVTGLTFVGGGTTFTGTMQALTTDVPLAPSWTSMIAGLGILSFAGFRRVARSRSAQS